MSNKILTGVILVVLSVLATGCGMIGGLVGGAMGGSLGTAAGQLWPDVPKMDGLTASSDQMPISTKLLLQTAITTMSGNLGSADWIAFTTDRTPDDVRTFYASAMAANGWAGYNDPACLNGADQGMPQLGTYCVFVKRPSGKEILVPILAIQDAKSKKTNVYFLRVESQATPTPK